MGFKEIAMGIGIAVLLGLFTGFFSFQVGDTVRDGRDFAARLIYVENIDEKVPHLDSMR